MGQCGNVWVCWSVCWWMRQASGTARSMHDWWRPAGCKWDEQMCEMSMGWVALATVCGVRVI